MYQIAPTIVTASYRLRVIPASPPPTVSSVVSLSPPFVVARPALECTIFLALVPQLYYITGILPSKAKEILFLGNYNHDN